MAFDYREEYPEFYQPKKKPSMVEIPKMNFVGVRGYGSPTRVAGEYYPAQETVLAIMETILSCKKIGHKIKGFTDFVMPPVEGFFWKEGDEIINCEAKQNVYWLVVIRLPDFITKAELAWAIEETKKTKEILQAEYITFSEGMCVQALHVGTPETQNSTVETMGKYVAETGYEIDMKKHFHHEIYLNDIRRIKRENWRMVLRQPVVAVNATEETEEEVFCVKKV
ncbi:MAG: GyrI-like domain-containing protein [Christensenellaceae bacterium]